MKPKLLLLGFVLVGASFCYLSMEYFQRGKTMIGLLYVVTGVAFWIRGAVEWRKSAGN